MEDSTESFSLEEVTVSQNQMIQNSNNCENVQCKVDQCKDSLFEHSQLPVLNVIWYPSKTPRDTFKRKISHVLMFCKRVLMTIILLLLKIGIPTWYIFMIVQLPAAFNEMSQAPMGELNQVQTTASEMMYELVYDKGRAVIIVWNVIVISLRVAIQALMVFTVEKDVLRSGFWCAIFSVIGTRKDKFLAYTSFALHLITSFNFLWTTHYYCTNSIYDTVEAVENFNEIFETSGLLMNIKRKRVLNFSNIVFLLGQIPVLSLMSNVDDFIREHMKVGIDIDDGDLVYKKGVTERARFFTRLLHHIVFGLMLVISVPLIVSIAKIMYCLFMTACCAMVAACCDYFLKNFGFQSE